MNYLYVADRHWKRLEMSMQNDDFSSSLELKKSADPFYLKIEISDKSKTFERIYTKDFYVDYFTTNSRLMFYRQYDRKGKLISLRIR